MIELKSRAMAKINLTLDITGRRDDGYHDIESIMQSVTLCDIVSLSLSDGDGKITVNCFGKSCGEENTAYKAALEFMKISGKKFNVHIDIEKHIPTAAGLGGGSADAAAVLSMLNDVYGSLSGDDLCSAALNVGADVPFCLSGGTALVKGIGEKVTPIQYIGDYYVVIVKSGEKNSTGRMYDMIDRMSDSRTHFTQGFLQKYENDDFCGAKKCTGNIFARLYSEYDKAAEKIRRFSPVFLSLSGAGPSVYGIFDSETAAKNCLAHYMANGTKAYICKTCSCGFALL
ncbi:MAG TPA: 4-(cytidine 5'-diphospho)-2-C-methyl-D-erythritol kinase [Firmicutes bacterium]|nr:4-(cytidine 5'-diphospho)-2-C-methyl-D-erythritol kinase [Bacillota bacterium]